jgi:hypothetical protein
MMREELMSTQSCLRSFALGPFLKKMVALTLALGVFLGVAMVVFEPGLSVNGSILLATGTAVFTYIILALVGWHISSRVYELTASNICCNRKGKMLWTASYDQIEKVTFLDGTIYLYLKSNKRLSISGVAKDSKWDEFVRALEIRLECDDRRQLERNQS